MKYIDADKLIAEIERQNVDKKVIEPLIRIITSLQQEQPQGLALTWEDIKKLDGIMDSMRTYTAWDAVDYPNDEDFYKEVLKRFNEIDTKQV